MLEGMEAPHLDRSLIGLGSVVRVCGHRTYTRRRMAGLPALVQHILCAANVCMIHWEKSVYDS